MSEETDQDRPIGSIIDELYELRAKRLAFEKSVEELKATETKLRGIIIARLKMLKLDGGKGTIANATIKVTRQARISSWPEFWEFCVQNNAHDLIQKRVSITAVRARWDEGVAVNGLEPFDVEDISLTKR